VLSKVEKAQASGKYFRQCLWNFAIPIPPHSCVHVDFEKPSYDFVKDLDAYYELHPGQYLITPHLKQGERLSTTGLTGRPKRYFDLCITGGACCSFGVSSGIMIHVGSPPRTKMRFPILPPLPIAEAQTTVVRAVLRRILSPER
jgi:hypothetical protein